MEPFHQDDRPDHQSYGHGSWQNYGRNGYRSTNPYHRPPHTSPPHTSDHHRECYPHHQQELSYQGNQPKRLRSYSPEPPLNVSQELFSSAESDAGIATQQPLKTSHPDGEFDFTPGDPCPQCLQRGVDKERRGTITIKKRNKPPVGKEFLACTSYGKWGCNWLGGNRKHGGYSRTTIYKGVGGQTYAKNVCPDKKGKLHTTILA